MSARTTDHASARTVSVSTSGNRWLPSRAAASAAFVTALSSCRNDPGPGRPRARSRFHAADRLGAPFEQVWPVLDQPLITERTIGLLVGKEGEHDVTPRHHPVMPEPARETPQPPAGLAAASAGTPGRQAAMSVHCGVLTASGNG
jgi:hypothetical protein